MTVDLEALRRAAFGPRPHGVSDAEHAREARAALELLQRVEAAGAADDPDATADVDADADADATVEARRPPSRRRPPRRLLVVAAAVLMVAAIAVSGIAAWRLAHPPLASLPGNEPSEALLRDLGVSEVTTVANWNGRSVVISPAPGEPSTDCMIIIFGADSVGDCGDPATVTLQLDAANEGVTTLEAPQPAVFTWRRGDGLTIEYRGERTASPAPVG